MNEHEIHEPLSKQSIGSLMGAIGFLWVYPLIMMIVSGKTFRELGWETILALAAALAVASLALAGLIFLMRRTKLTIDATGVTAKELFRKPCTIRWAEVRTAAVVILSGRRDMRQIVLSVQQPEEVLLRKRFFRRAPTSGEVRLEATEKRIAAVEYYLDRNLKEFDL